MSSKKKFKRDYIILEAKDMNFRYKERVLPKAFAKVEVNEDKTTIALYVENLKYMKDGYRAVFIQSDYETSDLGTISLSEQGKGEFVFTLEDLRSDIKAIALLYDKSVPLIGFKGSKIDNYEEILFMNDDEEYMEIDEEIDDDMYEYEYIEVEDDEESEYEYIEVEDDEDIEYEYIEIEEDDEEDNNDVNKYQEINNYKDINYSSKREYPSPKATNKNKRMVNESNREYASLEDYTYVDTENDRESKETFKSSSSLLMPRQIKKGLRHFKEAKPFVADYIENTRWWKIEINPTTLCGYSMPYLGYVNSLNYTMYSDAIMNSYKYRHYLFGVQYDEYNKRKRYIYAVPGNKNEQPDKGHTGFNAYQPCDTRNDSLGYWLCSIDSRTRKILK